jgi:hypothetical protein
MQNLHRDTLGNASKNSWRPFEQYLKGIGDSLENAQRVLETFAAMLHSIADKLLEMPKYKWRPDSHISHLISSQ